MKQTVVFDFDGVIHSYTSGWQGDTKIPDPVVPGIKEVIDELKSAGYCIAIVSARASTIKGIEAIKAYLIKNQIDFDVVTDKKPPALVYIDDRAINFNGRTEGLVEQIKNFKPWNR